MLQLATLIRTLVLIKKKQLLCVFFRKCQNAGISMKKIFLRFFLDIKIDVKFYRESISGIHSSIRVLLGAKYRHFDIFEKIHIFSLFLNSRISIHSFVEPIKCQMVRMNIVSSIILI